ncbi:MAG: methyltransferase [Planctomycetales bacterium]
MPAPPRFDSGSYRDRDGRVFYDAQGGVFRSLSEEALADWHAVSLSRFFGDALARGDVIETELLPPEHPVGHNLSGAWSGVLRHARIPFVSYPYEWSFGMLQDAALLQLALLAAALREDLTLKDGTAYNVQWQGTRPVFIDVASFVPLLPGAPWAGYRQFCQTQLYPLLLQAYKGIDFHPFLRGRLDGISPADCWRLMSLGDLFRRGVFGHVFLHQWLESRPAVDAGDVSKGLPAAGFNKQMIQGNVDRLQKLVGRLRWSPPQSTWSEYAGANRYSDQERELKSRFVRCVVEGRRWKRVWDLGCNTGDYSRIAAENADQVVAFDADHLAVERFYQALKQERSPAAANILPLVNDLVDPSTGLGWRGAERKGLAERGTPELTLCLALVHHLVIGRGVPLRELLDWFASLGTDLIIEFVSRQDPMVQRLLRGRRDNDHDYEQQSFERLLSERFEIVRSEPLLEGARVLYFGRWRGAA